MIKRTLSIMAMIVMLAGCSQLFSSDNDGQEELQPIPSEDIITVTISTPQWMSSQEFENWFVLPLSESHPAIQLNRIVHDSQLKSSSETVPDLILMYTWQLPHLEEHAWAYDLEPLIKRYDFDLETIESAAIDLVRASNVENLLIALPVASDFGALYYNKDIFDKFHVSYPKDQMTWPELIELAKRVTAAADGIQYGGFGFAGLSVDMMFASLPFVDPETERAVVHTEQWSKLFQYAKELYDIPGNGQMILGAENYFMNQKTLAMMMAPNLLKELRDEFNWDLAAMPILEEAPDTGRAPFGLALAVTKQSEKKEQAIQIISSVLSEEAQMEMARNGRPGVIRSSSWMNVFGENLPHLEGKHVQAAFSSTPIRPLTVTRYDQTAQQIMQQAIIAYAEQGMDIDVVLQMAEEQINRYIDELKQSQD